MSFYWTANSEKYCQLFINHLQIIVAAMKWTTSNQRHRYNVRDILEYSQKHVVYCILLLDIIYSGNMS